MGGSGEGARLIGDVLFLKEQEEGQVIVHAATKGGTLGSKVTLRSTFQKRHNPPGRAEVSVPGEEVGGPRVQGARSWRGRCLWVPDDPPWATLQGLTEHLASGTDLPRVLDKRSSGMKDVQGRSVRPPRGVLRDRAGGNRGDGESPQPQLCGTTALHTGCHESVGRKNELKKKNRMRVGLFVVSI